MVFSSILLSQISESNALEFSLESFLRTVWNEAGWLQFWICLLFDALTATQTLPPRRWRLIQEQIVRAHAEDPRGRYTPLVRRDDDEYMRQFLAFVLNAHRVLEELQNDSDFYQWLRDVWFQRDVESMLEFVSFVILGAEPPGLGGRHASVTDAVSVNTMVSVSRHVPWCALLKPALRRALFGRHSGSAVSEGADETAKGVFVETSVVGIEDEAGPPGQRLEDEEQQVMLRGKLVPRPICADRALFQFGSCNFTDAELFQLRLLIMPWEKPYQLFSSEVDGRSFSKMAQRLALYSKNPVLLLLGPIVSGGRVRRFFGGFAEGGFEERGGKYGLASATNSFLFGVETGVPPRNGGERNEIVSPVHEDGASSSCDPRLRVRRGKSSLTNNFTLLNSRNTYQHLGLGFGGQQECPRLFLSADDWSGHVLFSDRMYEEGHLFENLRNSDSSEEEDQHAAAGRRIEEPTTVESPPFKWDFPPVSVEVYGFGGPRALEEMRENAEAKEGARETHRKVDRAKLVENAFDREVLFERTFAAGGGGDRAAAEVESRRGEKRAR